jgi:hypothetical protein
MLKYSEPSFHWSERAWTGNSMQSLDLSERKPNAMQIDPGEGMQTQNQALAPLIQNLVGTL